MLYYYSTACEYRHTAPLLMWLGLPSSTVCSTFWLPPSKPHLYPRVYPRIACKVSLDNSHPLDSLISSSHSASFLPDFWPWPPDRQQEPAPGRNSLSSSLSCSVCQLAQYSIHQYLADANIHCFSFVGESAVGKVRDSTRCFGYHALTLLLPPRVRWC